MSPNYNAVYMMCKYHCHAVTTQNKSSPSKKVEDYNSLSVRPDVFYPLSIQYSDHSVW